MKLTKRQLGEMFNQHTGTGYIILKTSFNNCRIADIGINKRGEWYLGLDGKPLVQGLERIAKEIIDED